LTPRAMPADHRLGLNEDQRPLPIRPEPPKQNPEEPIRCPESGLRMSSFEHGELLAKSEDLQKQ